MSFYLLNVTIHVLAAILWLGGMLFLAVVGAPILRRVEPAALRAQLFRQLGLRFRLVGWIAVGVLIVTGVLNLHFRDLLRWEVLGAGAFWAGTYGRALAVKLAAVGVMLVLSLVHDFVLGPAASRAPPGSDAALGLRRRASWLARINAVVALVVIVAAVRLTRGG